MRIEKEQATVYQIMEQPGDSTRYSHLVVVTEDYVIIQKDPLDDGAGLNKSTVMQKAWLTGQYEEIATAPIMDAARLAGQLPTCLRKDEPENPWTMASAIRCGLAAIETNNI